jgi:hypothetical protein
VSNEFEKSVNEPNLLRVMIQMHDWEVNQREELQTLTGRDLYFRIAEVCLNDLQSTQQLKLFQGRSTERALRQRMREFEEVGLIHVSNNTSDQRTKCVVPTEKFLQHLNQHLDRLKFLCDRRFLMVDKNQYLSEQSNQAGVDCIHS